MYEVLLEGHVSPVPLPSQDYCRVRLKQLTQFTETVFRGPEETRIGHRILQSPPGASIYGVLLSTYSCSTHSVTVLATEDHFLYGT